ncbi:MAG: GLPGLI family protein [Chitinophagaceae bacterium]|nr:MAG: GLPGLI family protein [Chitinophagaceae bacterium]
MKLFLNLLFFFLLVNSYAQYNQVVYDIKQATGRTSVTVQFDDFVHVSKMDGVIAADASLPGLFVKDKRTKAIYGNDRLLNMNFFVRDSLYPMKWEILQDTMTILGEPCQAAATYFRGRNYKAFFAPGIPSDDGPAKFGGLPGLILNVRSMDGFIEWNAVSLSQNKPGDILVPALEKYKFLDWPEFVIKYKEAVARLIKLSRSNGNVPNDGEMQLLLEAVEIFYPELQTGKGIKF